uniref:Uncharacterized protein n=1 Tax=Anguilla anguilla TaxID=7936 RepID=A0A0E9XFX9_ANGAN
MCGGVSGKALSPCGLSRQSWKPNPKCPTPTRVKSWHRGTQCCLRSSHGTTHTHTRARAHMHRHTHTHTLVLTSMCVAVETKLM